jgi:5,10-methylene-tetrahydrofolate dehydrogenase/methenyl tetrahydrofolate cyclohydrolase
MAANMIHMNQNRLMSLIHMNQIPKTTSNMNQNPQAMGILIQIPTLRKLAGVPAWT